MPSGFDSAWCRVGSARVTPNEAVPLPAWAGWVTRPGSNSRSADRSAPRAGKSALSPDGDIITIPVSVLALDYPVPLRFSGLRQNPAKALHGDRHQRQIPGFSSTIGKGAAPRFTRHS